MKERICDNGMKIIKFIDEEFRKVKYQFSSGEIVELDKYLISNYGRVINLKKEKFQPMYANKDGYLCFAVCFTHNWQQYRMKMLTNRAVALVFIPNTKNKATVNHKDLNRKNNKDVNLEWATSRENNHHAMIARNSNSNIFTDDMCDYFYSIMKNNGWTYKELIRGFEKRYGIGYDKNSIKASARNVNKYKKKRGFEIYPVTTERYYMNEDEIRAVCKLMEVPGWTTTSVGNIIYGDKYITASNKERASMTAPLLNIYYRRAYTDITKDYNFVPARLCKHKYSYTDIHNACKLIRDGISQREALMKGISFSLYYDLRSKREYKEISDLYF